MPVDEVFNLTQLNNTLERSDANRLIIVDFFANWCGPCKMISPIFEQLSMEFGNATFLKVNCDSARDIVTRYSISAMPTFLFFKNKQQVDSVRGANQNAIVATIRKHYSSTPANPNSASDQEKKFLETFVRYTDLRRNYTDEVFKALARSVMPEGLSEKLENGGDEREVLKVLLEWFKTEFFTWFDKPTCPNCTLKCTTEGLQGTPMKQEQEGGANRVEVYICDGCNTEMRFPRYNNPARLLQTRTGRCGEWANCFGLLLSAIGLEARFVLDTTDHVWNEVYIKKENRWIHVDPCENTMDRPLLYTRGWNKKLRYCVAYGLDHVADVTWRYVFDSKKTIQERVEVRQQVFENFLSKLNARQMAEQSDARKKELAVRRVCELMEMMAQEAKNQKIGWEELGDDLGGRTTGSDEWRRARGEMGTESSTTPKSLGEPIKLTTSDKSSIEFSYDINRDTYSQSPEKGFIAQAFECDNVKRVVETDWNFVYLCREDGKKDGNISWHFDLEPLGASIEKVEVRMAGIQNFEKGRVMAIACLGDTCMRIPSDGNLTINEPKAGILKVSVTLSGGEGSIAFQQAQLFRTERKTSDSDKTESMVVKVYMK